MASEYSYEDRIKMFAKEKSLLKFTNKRMLFPDRMNMYSWFTYNEKKILNSKDKYCVIIAKQHEDYLRHIKDSIPFLQDVKDFDEDIKKIEQEEKLEAQKHDKTGFYTLFPDYTIEQVNTVINNSLSQEHKDIILKKHGGNLFEEGKAGVLTASEKNIYSKIKNRIINIIEGNTRVTSPKRSNPKRPKTFYALFPNASEDEIDNLFKKLTDIRKAAVLKRHDGDLSNIQNFEIKLSKNESGAYAEAITYITEKLDKPMDNVTDAPIDYDENVAYLKLHELLQTKYFTDALMQLEPEYAMVILLKLKNPTRTAKEISDFANIPYEKVVKILQDGLNILELKLDGLFNKIFTDYSDIKTEVKTNKKDN